MWKRYSIISLRGEVLDEGEGLGNLGHNGVEEPVVVGADSDHRLRRAILQYPGHLSSEVLIFWQKSLRTIHTYHLVPFNLPKNVQRGPFQGLLDF